MSQPSVTVEQRQPGQTHAFRNGFPGHPPAPDRVNLIGRHAVGEFVQHLPDHDARAFESRFAVADVRIGHDVAPEFHPGWRALFTVFHGGNLHPGSRCGKTLLATGSKDAALTIALQPGQYTVQLSGVGSTTGEGVVAVYEVP